MFDGKQWICTICGYIHTGSEPPEFCPQCGAPREKFVRYDPGSVAEARPSSVEAPSGETAGVTGPQPGPQAGQTTADVIVVGSGAAGFAAAVTARSKGLSVIMLEKAPTVGGTTIRSGGGFWTPHNRFQRARGVDDDRAATLRYMARYSYPHLYRPADERFGVPEPQFRLLEAMVDHAAAMTEHFESLGVFESFEEINWTGKPQVDYQDHLPENGGVRGRGIYTRGPDGNIGYGFVLVGKFKAWAEARGIRILVDHEVVRIRRDDRGVVIGVEARFGGATKTFTAHKAVIFGTGGFSHNPELMLHFSRGPIFGGCSAPTNTGDFIRLGGELGARIGNTGGAFRAQAVFESVLSNPGGSNNVFFIPGDSVLQVNRLGQRVMNEKRNYQDRGMVHFIWDPNRAEWTNMLLFLIYDARTADLWQGFPPYPAGGPEAPYVVSARTLRGLAGALSRRLKQLKDHTGGFTLDERFATNLSRTVARFNHFATSGKDEDFGRGDFAYDREWTTFPPTKPGAGPWPADMDKNYTMYPLSKQGPYHAVILSSSTLDTNGGPVINEHGQVLDVRDRPIEGLYGAGNCIASPTANAYWGPGSTIGPAMTFGYLAALHAAER